MLLSIPEDAYIVENSTRQTGLTAAIWGAKNKDLEEARDRVVKDRSLKAMMEGKKLGEDEKQRLYNSLNHIGVYKGKNLMGKILKLCQLALLNRMELEIDYALLKSKNIHLLGELLTFDSLI